jgi:GLPGLI family protein
MKTKITSLTLLLFPAFLSGQDKQVTSGRITYDEKVKIEIKLDGEAAAFAQNLPRERSMEKILTFNSDGLLFEDGKSNVEDEMDSGHGDSNVRFRMVVSGENKTFTDLKSKKVIEQRDFMNRIFLVEKDLSGTDWKITGNQKNILGYNCIEATKTDTAGKKTVAWFAPSIPVGGGPADLRDLPGMILEADINNGTRVYTAKSIEALSLTDVKIQKPKEGKQVSEDEYKKVVAEKMKEMGIEEGQGGNQMRVIIRHQ